MKRTITQIRLVSFLIVFIFSALNICAQNSMVIESSTTIVNNNGKKRITFSIKGSNSFEIKHDGKIILSNDDADIKDISDGGYLEITKSSFGKRRKITIEKDEGKLFRKYFIGNTEKKFYPDGKKWLEEILPEIIKSTTIGAESRVNRFYKKGGAKKVLAEIIDLDSDFIKSAYFKLLLKKNLSTKEITTTLQTVGDNVDSDFYISSILTKNQHLFLKNAENIDAYINASKNVSSDFYLSQILKGIVANNAISDTQLARLLKISKSMSSDFYLTEVLEEILDERRLNISNIEQILLISKNVNSDHYKTSLLKKVLKIDNLSDGAYHIFINSLKEISSDHYTTEILKQLVKKKLHSENLSLVLKIIQNNISSSHYQRTIYKQLAHRNDLNEVQLISILNTLKSINSSYDLSSALLAFAPRVKKSSNNVKEAYKNTAKSINSDTYYGRAIKAIN